MSCTVVFIGGGSFLWTGRLATDLFLKPSLHGSCLRLVDIDRESRDVLVRYCRLLNERLAAGWTIEAAELEPALEGADFVMISVSTGGLDAFERDYHIPEKYGVFPSVGDTVGPSGISRTLRNAPVFVDLARRMERICPDAWLVHVTNPLAQLTRCVCRATSIKTIGLCHNFEGTMCFLGSFLGADRAAVHADTFGVNHFTWLRNLTCHGRPVSDEQLTVEQYLRWESKRHAPVDTGTTDDDVRAMLKVGLPNDERLTFELYERFGFFPVGGPSHVAENLPFYLNDAEVIRRHRIRRKGVLPERRDGREKKRRRILDMLEGRLPLDPLVASHEDFAHVVESLHTGKSCRAVVNVPNRGQIENLPADVVVETWAQIGRDQVTPLPAGAVPTALKGMIESIIVEEELTVEAALTGDRRLVVQALFVSPVMQDKDAVEALADELLAAQRQYLPQFQLEPRSKKARQHEHRVAVVAS